MSPASKARRESSAQPYRPGKRDWAKVKHRDTVEVICAAVSGPLHRPDTLIVGLPINGELRVVGRTTPLNACQRRTLAPALRAPSGQHPWPTQIPPTAVTRFMRDRDPIDLTLIEPFVAEVTADTAWSGNSFRHPLRYVRIRSELHPDGISPPRSLITREAAPSPCW